MLVNFSLFTYINSKKRKPCKATQIKNVKTLDFFKNSRFPGLLHFEKIHSCHDAPH